MRSEALEMRSLGDSGEEMEKDVSVSHVNKFQQMPTICLQYAYNMPTILQSFFQSSLAKIYEASFASQVFNQTRTGTSHISSGGRHFNKLLHFCIFL